MSNHPHPSARMDFIQILLNLCVIGSSGYGLSQLEPAAHPYGYVAAAFCLVQGIMDFLRMVQGDEDCSRSFTIANCIVSFIPLPLANIEFYAGSGQANFALLHTLSLILVFYKTVERMCDDDVCASDITVDLSVLLNVASAIQLYVQEENPFHLGVGLAALFARYGSMVLEPLCPSIDFNSYLDKIGRAAMIGAMVYGLTEG